MEPQKEPNPNYLPYPSQSQSTDDQIDLYELFNALWRGKWLVIATTFLFSVGSVLYALSLPNVYKAYALLAPAETSNGGGLSKMAGQFGGLAAIAGVNLGNGESSETELAVQVLRSRKFIKNFIEKHDLLVPLMAANGWDLTNNKLILNRDIYDVSSGKWLREANGVRGAKPTDQEAFEVFNQDVLEVEKIKDANLYTIAIKHYSPNIAKQWVNWLVDDINKVMRERAIAATSQNLSYLNAQLEKTAVADMRSTFYKLIEEQTKSLMLAQVQEEFVFKVIDPAIAPEVKESPKRALICALGLLIGFMLGVALVMVRFAIKTANKSPL
ncbi:Wzz/FepE/Etk N-terminal domain-containing protein [Vibrio diabolicus]|uniref:Wzz/FepE/Etk N-terminal domain-containing protein n=1 Tax=Vibrio diabolicus TaxID=50719 RepID=UPI003751A387